MFKKELLEEEEDVPELVMATISGADNNGGRNQQSRRQSR
jgi:hypothetical protein